MEKSVSASVGSAPGSPSVLQIRLVLGTLFGSAIIVPGLYQRSLEVLWDYLKTSALYRSSTFETLWTVFCYCAVEPYITYVFMQHPEWRFVQPKPVSASTGHDYEGDDVKAGSSIAGISSSSNESTRRTKPKGMRRPARRGFEALTYIVPLLLLDLTMIKKFAGVPLEDKLISGNYPPSLAHDPSSYHRGHFLMPSIHNFSASSPLQTTRALPAEAPSSRRLALELIASFVIYDAVFFLFHLSLHVTPLLKRWHNPHHTHAEIHPQITNQLSIFERLGLVLLANFSLNIIGAHVLTRTLFVPVFVWLLVEIHCGMDLPWGYDKVLPKGWGGGARQHARHHDGGEGGLEPYFEWCDGLWDRCRGVRREKAG